MKSIGLLPTRSRWVTSDLADLKRTADQAGSDYREAKKRCIHSNLEYYWHRQLLKLKPMEQIYYVPSPGRVEEIRDEIMCDLRRWDAERQAASVALHAAKLRLDKAIWQYREAKSWKAGNDEG